MPLKPEDRERLLKSTRDAAIALLEDMQHVREVVEKPEQTRGEVRRLSGILRRLLPDDDLRVVAAPRIGRVFLKAPDNKPFYKACDDSNYAFFGSGEAHVFGLSIRAAMSTRRPVEPQDFDPERTVLVRIDGFLSQRVICYQGKWANRKGVIKYVANVASGIHSGAAQTDEEKLLSAARHALVYGLRPAGVGLAWRQEGDEFDETKLAFTDAAIDTTLVELLAAARYLVISDDVIELEAAIKDEIGQ